MRLIVFKNLDTKYRYGDKIIKNLPFFISSQTVGKKVLLVTADKFDPSSLRGYNFTDLLFVGYEDQLEVVGKCPVEIQASVWNVPSERRHYCKPAEAKKSPSGKPEPLPQGLTSAHALKYLAEQEKALRDSASLGTGFLNVEFSEEGSIKPRKLSHWEVYNDNLSSDYLDSLRYTIMVKPV